MQSQSKYLTHAELSALWSAHFASPFPDNSHFYWTRFERHIVIIGFEAVAKKMKTHQFSNLADACRFATGAMRTAKKNEEASKLPAPTLTGVN